MTIKAKDGKVKTVKCHDCGGTGVYHGAGSVVNGVFVGFTGVCYRCGGKGVQTRHDKARNWGYDNYYRHFRMS